MKIYNCASSLFLCGLIWGFGLAGEVFAQSERFAGILVNAEGKALQGKVNINSVSTTTSAEDGSFEMYVPRADPYRISASVPGYASYSEVYSGVALSKMQIQLLGAETEVFDSTKAFDKTDGRGTRVRVPAGALVDANGNPPSAPVVASIHTYDIGNEQQLGDMTALDTAGRKVALRGRGAVMIQFSDGAGNIQYNLAAGKKAILSLVTSVGGSVSLPAWKYDVQTAVWRQDGAFSVENEVATGEVGHVGVWQVGLAEATPACVQMKFDRAWFRGQGYGPSKPFQLLARVAPPDARTIKLSFASVDNGVLYNLTPNSQIEFFLDGKSHAIVTAGVAWGGTGVPVYPFSECKSFVLFEGKVKVGTIKGRALRQHRTSHGGLSVQALIGTSSFSAVTAPNGEFSLSVPPGQVTLKVSRAGYLPAQRDMAVVALEQPFALSEVTMVAGDVDNSGCVGVVDMRLINGVKGSSVAVDDVRDLDGNMVIDFEDLRLAAHNGDKCGPSPWLP